LAAPAAQEAADVAAGTIVKVRLRQAVSSFGSDPDDRITVEVIAPVEVGGRIRVPMGARILGHVEGTRRVGIGLSREVAHVDLSFDTLELPGGEQVPVRAVVAAVDNARETVGGDGRIYGIRATSSFSSAISGAAVSVGFIDPILLAFTLSSTLAAFRIPESEIIFPPGTELRLRLLEPFTRPREYAYPVGPVTRTAAELAALEELVGGLPFRTATPNDNIPSDITNLLFIGSEQALTTAFEAAGWSQTEDITAGSVYGVMRAIVENQGYQEAPMSTLLLAGRAPAHTYAKTLNTFFARHHLRIFARPETLANATVWTSSSTQDTGIGIATRTKTFIHIIDEQIDHERDKVVDDLVLTGCVDGVQLVERPWVPRDAYNATGDALLTDGRIAVIELNECASPQRATEPLPEAPTVREKPNAAERVVRNLFLTLKNDIWRGNIVYQGYWGARLGLRALFRREPDPEATRVITLGGQPFEIVRGPEAPNHPAAPEEPADEDPSFEPIAQWPATDYASQLEFSFAGGYMRFGNDAFSTQEVTVVPVDGSGGVPSTAAIGTRLRSGWNIAPRLTLNSHRHVSHEFAYVFNSLRLRGDLAGAPVESQPLDDSLGIRQFSYSVLLHARPLGSRVRPYAAIGPALQLIRADESIARRRGIFRFGFKPAAVIAGAWDFGNRPSLEGGGIFQPGLQYGGGVDVYLSEHIVLRVDFRETISAQPDFWTRSHASIREFDLGEGLRAEPGALIKHGPLRHQVFTLGLGVAF
jgi:hypothetical protein